MIINPATSVRCRYYGRFAAYLFGHDFDVLTFDYRGVGLSRPPSLRGFRAGWADWGQLDFEAVLRFTAAHFPGRPIHVVGHSIGGFVIGLAPSNPLISRILTVGAQFAYWRDYEATRRIAMRLKWHLAMPLITRMVGYLPARRLGGMEDTPRGVARDWAGMTGRFEDSIAVGPGVERPALALQFRGVTAPILAISLTDDPFGTIAAIERLLAYYANSARTHVRIAPEDIGQTEIGHFAFFHDRFRTSLWPVALAWLQSGRIPALGRIASSPEPEVGSESR